MVLVLRQHPPVDRIGNAAKSIPLQLEQPAWIIERLASNDRNNGLDTHLPIRSRQCVCPFRSNSAEPRRRLYRTECRPYAVEHPPLDLDGTAQGIHHAGELDQHAIARGLHDASAVLGWD